MGNASLEVATLVALLNDGWDGSGPGDPDRLGLFAEELIATAAARVRAWRAAGIGVHARGDPGYPAQLAGVPDAPPVVFTRGRLAADARAVAVVGTRSPSPAGLSRATAIARALGEAGFTVVSGLALGVDTAAHRAALAVGARTVAVVGTGVDRCYPAANTPLQRHIARAGLVFSRWLPESPPSATSFLARNAVLSGYCLATVVVEAGDRSGARVAARLALAQGRRVILPRPVLAQPWARDYAARPGVVVAGDLVELLAAVESAATGRGYAA